MGRRNLSRAAAIIALVLFSYAAPASAALRWHLVARGDASELGSQAGYVALDRNAAKIFAPWIGQHGVAALDRVDFSRSAVVAVLGPYGCADNRIDVASVTQHDSVLDVKLVEHALPPGTVQCDAVFETYRLLTVGKASLIKPYPTWARVSLARA